jgi:hypothetical protein
VTGLRSRSASLRRVDYDEGIAGERGGYPVRQQQGPESRVVRGLLVFRVEDAVAIEKQVHRLGDADASSMRRSQAGSLLHLHSVMVGEGWENGEGEFPARVRCRPGPVVPVIVALDLHANMT